MIKFTDIISIIVMKETKVLFGVVVMRRLALSVVMIFPPWCCKDSFVL